MNVYLRCVLRPALVQIVRHEPIPRWLVGPISGLECCVARLGQNGVFAAQEVMSVSGRRQDL